VSDPFERQATCDTYDYDRWFFACERWWDEVGWEEASDYLYLPWQEWYAAGYTVDAAVRAAHRETFGRELP
jgi:hypothetical protein